MAGATEASGVLNAHALEMKKNFKFNYGISAAEGGLFLGGLAFVETNTILPKIIDSLGGADWLIAFIPLSLYLGQTIPQMFVAHHIEKLPRMKKFVLIMGFLQRIVFLCTGLFLIFASDFAPWLVITSVAFTPMISGLFIGGHIAAWQEMVARTILPHRFSSLWAIRFSLGAAIGIVSGKFISHILKTYDNTDAYGVLYCTAFGLFMLSLGVISFTREPALPVLKREHKGGGLSEFIRSVGPIIQNDKNHTNYCMVRLFSNGIFVIAPFLAIRAIEIMQKSDSYIGFLISVQMLGSILSYLIAGYVGDKWGIKQVVKLNHLTALITVVWAAFAQHQIEFAIIFVLFGMTLGFNQIGIIPMGIRLAPQDKRISYMTIQGFASFPGLFLAWGLAIVGKMASGSMLWLSIAAFVMMAVSSFYLARTNDSSS